MQVGGAIGLAVLATLATERTDALRADGESTAAALNSGYHLAYLVGAALVVAAIVVAALACALGARCTAEDEARGRSARAGLGRGGLTALEIDTPHGPARAHLHPADEPIGALVLGHGAGGGVDGPGPRGGHRGAPSRRGSASRSSSSPTAWPGDALPLRRASSTRPGRRWSITCAAAS